MEHPGFFERAGPLTLAAVAERTAGEIARTADAGKLIGNVAALDVAGPDDLSFIDNSKYLPLLARTRAGACLVATSNLAKVPPDTIAVVVADPYRAFALALQAFYPTGMHPHVATGEPSDYRDGVHRSAMLEDGVHVQPGAIVGPEARIGRGTVIAAGAVVGYRVCIGRDGYVGPNSTLVHTLAGDRLTIHGGVQCGHDGFGFAMGRRGHLKVPQVGRVIIQDDVEIGANTAIDRGALKDTVIGEGSKIDNLIQIGHNVTMGRHCVVAAHTAIAGSVTIGDFVVIGGAVAIAGHLTIGSGTQIAGRAGITNHLRPGSRVGGFPARPLKFWAREVATLKRLASRDKSE